MIRYEPRPDLILAFLRAPERAIGSEDTAPARLGTFGLRAFIVGLLGMIVVSALTGGDIRVTGARVFSALLWASARLGMLLFFTKAGHSQRHAVITGWAAGLLPFVLGVTSGLRGLAFIASAIYTDAALVGSGLDRKRSAAAVARTFGAQGVVVGAAWAGRAIIAALMTLGASF